MVKGGRRIKEESYSQYHYIVIRNNFWIILNKILVYWELKLILVMSKLAKFFRFNVLDEQNLHLFNGYGTLSGIFQ